MPTNSRSTKTDSTNTAAIEPDATEPTKATGPSEAGAQVSHLATEWVTSHAAVLQKTTALVMADARLAATSGIQLLALGIAFALLLICTWATLMFAIAVGAHALGASIGTIAAAAVLLHILLLGILGWAIKSTSEGLQFNASRMAISKPSSDVDEVDKTTNV